MWLFGNLNSLVGLMYTLTSMLPDVPGIIVNRISDFDYSDEMQPLSHIQKINSADVNVAREGRFPNDFLFGVSTSAYQTEGAWNVSNKSQSVWDYMTHQQPGIVKDETNADIAANSYYLYKTDIELSKQVGANAFRISLSWPRILPNGFSNYINAKAIDHYNNVIDEMLRRNITPVVTIYHWDLPQKLQDLGGWSNPLIIDWFVDFARIAFDAFGDRVKYWVTINEPSIFCGFGYGGDWIPLVQQSGVADYLCGHHALIAHAKAYEMYQNEFAADQEGQVGIVISLSWPVAENPEDEEELEGVERWFQFRNGWFLHPIFSDDGDYPKEMIERISYHSDLQGFSKSRLPKFSENEIEMIKNSADYLGINFYHASSIRKWTDYDIKNTVSFYSDIGMLEKPELEYSTTFTDRCTPWALVAAIQRMNKEFNISTMIITENGYWDRGQLADISRARYHHLHLSEIPKLIAQGINIRGYFVWSLIDNFEWMNGYSVKFGIFSVDFEDPLRNRIPKMSSKVISDIYKTKKISPFFWPLENKEFGINVIE
ncbi:myrosinase 1 [Chelonus insularis]|uniref:myrosinase 1 n=1 Tax=Chelonus insularis TaxID=460826 RepID=UPI00158D0408|nr:myrosinase 1 [Chelonus insularis]